MSRFVFWLGRFEALPGLLPPDGAGPWTSLATDADGAASGWGVEVLHEPGTDVGGQAVLAVLVSRWQADDVLTCVAGFANRCALGDRLRQAGFPVLDAVIHLYRRAGSTEGVEAFDVEVERPAGFEPGTVLELRDIRLRGGPELLHDLTLPRYRQWLRSPALFDSDRQLTSTRLDWNPWREVAQIRGRPSASAAPGGFGAASGGGPGVVAAQPAPVQAVHDCTGTVVLGDGAVVRQGPKAPAAWSLPARESVAAALPREGFRFDDVELFGFRIDLPRQRRPADEDAVRNVLRDLVAPLNFHRTAGLPDACGAQAFRYEAASRTLVIELLRYGAMRWGLKTAPGAPDLSTGQHELLVRVLVGRVDGGDTAQARSPALFVPTLFVDNPWSRYVGRELNGFDKHLACFAVGPGPDAALAPDSCRTGTGQDGPVPLSAITRVCLADGAGARPTEGSEVLQLQLPTVARLAPRAGTALADQRWRQSCWRQHHFDDPLFRRGFAAEALRWSPTHLPGIQASPVDGRPLPHAWINASFGFEQFEALQPAGVAQLALGDAGGLAPAPWAALVGLLRQLGSAEIALPTGDWYHARGHIRMRPRRGLL